MDREPREDTVVTNWPTVTFRTTLPRVIEKRGAFEGRNQPGPSPLKMSEAVGIVGALIYALFAFCALIAVGLAGLVFVIWLIKTIWRAV